MPPVIQVSGISKAYGSIVAVAEASFEVNEGEIFGLIGPNGAGKTTTMECIEGLRKPDRGSITVLGLDPYREVYKLQERIGVQLQEAQLQKRIKVWEAIDLWASLYQKKAVDGERLLEQLGLSDKRGSWFMHLSGGQKQRLFIALALINDPEVVFLDELTTGLDPQARRTIWDLVRDIRERGKTVFLTTHLMEEAERLCDRVAIIENGRIIDVDTPGLQCDTAPRHRSEDLFYRLGGRAQPLLQQHVTCFIEHAVKARPIAQIQTDGQASVLLVECLLHRRRGKLLHRRSPCLPRFKRVDNLGA
jgi:ABC-2 type transport system ATP-binding protein